MQDLMALKSMGSENGLTPYEQYKVGFMQSKKPSGVAIAGLTVASVAAVAGVTAWIFGGMQANAKGKEAKEAAYAAKEIAGVQNQATQRQLDQLTNLFAAERNERINGDQTITQTITDTVSGSQQSALTAQQAAELSAVNSVMTKTYEDFVTGRASLNPTPVSLYSAPQPCACPASGCGCGA